MSKLTLNPSKLTVICLVIVCATAALIAGRISAVEWMAIIGPFGGYLIGNGRSAAAGDTAQPAIGPRHPTTSEGGTA